MASADTWKQMAKRWEHARLPAEGVALALGGGAVLGAAHIGVLKALDEYGIKVKRISGTSIGAMIAALYAFGKTPEEIKQSVIELEWLDVTSFTLSRYGILSNDELGSKVANLLGKVDISEAPTPLYLIATDLTHGTKIVLSKGDVSRAVMASTCMPGVFVPVEIDGELLVDGGLIENVPVSPLRKAGARFVIGVNLSAGRDYQRPQDIIDVFANAIDIAIDNVTLSQTSQADLIIAPRLSSYSRRDMSRIPELIEEGYQSTKQLLDKLKS